MKKLQKGFTLVELMIVVAIIGILAAIAIPNFIKYQLRTKSAEAGFLIESLRKAQEALIANPRPIVVNNILEPNYSVGQFWNVRQLQLPAGVPGTGKRAWLAVGELDVALAMDWSPEGATYYSYQIVSGAVGGCQANPVAANSGSCFAAGAVADIDGDAVLAMKVLMRPSTGAAPITPALPPLVTAAGGAWPPAVPGNTCIDVNLVPTLNMYCSLSNSDTF